MLNTELLFDIYRGDYRKPQPIKVKNCGALSQYTHPQNIPAARTQEMSRKKEQAKVRARKSEICCKLVFPSNGKTYPQKFLSACLHKHEMNKDTTNEHAAADRENLNIRHK